MMPQWGVDLEGHEYWTHFITNGEPVCGKVSLHGNNKWTKEPKVINKKTLRCSRCVELVALADEDLEEHDEQDTGHPRREHNLGRITSPISVEDSEA
jgi:hypothetical protein